MANKVRANSVYTYKPVGLDVYDSKCTATEGQKVRVVKLHGCPPPNTMGHAHVESMGGEFLGLVLTNSLIRP